MRKTFVLFVLLALFIVSLTSAQDDSLAGVDPTGVTISYWHEWAGTQETGMDQIIEAFNSSNPYGITVEQTKFGAGSGVSDNVSAGITSGELPNITGDAFVSRAQGWYLDGVLVPLDAYLTHPEWGLSEEEMANINMDVLAINRPALPPFDGQLLAWPVGVSSNVKSVNVDMLNTLREQGVIDFEGVPTTFEDFRTAACAYDQLTSPDGSALNGGWAIRGSADELSGFVYSAGGTIFDEENDRYDFTNEGAITAMNYLQELYNDGCAYYAEGGTFANTGEFSLGLNMFAMGSSVGVPFIQGDMNNAGFDINWINTTGPWTEGNRTLATFLRGVAILQGTPEENLAAWLFIKYWATDPEAQRIWTESAQYQPFNSAIPALLSEEFLSGNPQFTSFAEALADPDINIWSSPSHPRSGEISEILAELFSNITIGGMDVETAAAEAEERANEVYQEVLEDLEG